MKIDTHNSTSQLLDIVMTKRLALCITRPTRITNTSVTLIDNINVSAEYCNSCLSGIMISDISDNFPLIVGAGNSEGQNTEPLVFKCRKLDNELIKISIFDYLKLTGI